MKNTTRLLIVDDEENYLAALRRILHGDFEVITTKDPVQALKIFEFQGPFAVVISDYKMPLMNGIHLFSKIHAINQNTQRIMITGHADLQMAIDAVNYGKITAFLTKPTPSASMRSIILEAVQAYNKSLYNNQTSKSNSYNKIAPADPLPVPLTIKEKEVLALLAKGFSNHEISKELNVTVGTVKSHVNNIFVKLDVNNRTKAVAKAAELGLIRNVL